MARTRVTRPPPSGRRGTALAIILIACTGLVAYWTSFAGAFVFDDVPAIVDNPHVRRLLPLGEAAAAPPDTTVAGRPVASLSFALSYALGSVLPQSPGAESHVPAGSPLAIIAPRRWTFHATNLLVHLLAALALYGVLSRTLESPRLASAFGRAAPTLALGASLVWLAHPLQTQAVTYVVQRVESLAGLFLLLTLYCFIRAREERRRLAWSAAAIASCALGMATKEVMACAPLVALLWDRTFGGDEDVRGRRWLGAALASTWLILGALALQGHRTQSVGLWSEEWPWWRYLLTQGGVLLHYLRLAILPWPLVFAYDWPPAASVLAAAPAVAVVGTLVVLTAIGVVRRRPEAFAGAVVFLVLAPTSSVLPIVTEIAAEHRMYVPLAALVALACVAGWRLATSRLGFDRGRRAWTATCAAVVLVFTGLTAARNRDYRSELSLWTDTAAKRPDDAAAHAGLGAALLERSRFAEAERELRRSEALRGDDPLVLANLGVVLVALGRQAESIPYFQRASVMRPDDAALRRHLGDAYLAGGELERALASWLESLERAPDDVEVLNKAARVLTLVPRERRPAGADAVALATRAVEATGRRDAPSLHSLGLALADAGRIHEARGTLEEALALATRSGPPALAQALEQQLESLPSEARGDGSR